MRYEVAVFPSGKTSFVAHLRAYNPEWPKCCIHEVEATTGAKAKRAAIEMHKEGCLQKGEGR